MATNWLVVEVEEGATEGVATLLANEDAAQQHIIARLNGGIAVERLQLFAAASAPFAVSYQPLVSIGGTAKKTSKPAAVATATAAPVAAEAEADVADKDAAAGTQNGVRFSSMFKNS